MKSPKLSKQEIKYGNKIIAEFMVGKPFISKCGVHVNRKVFSINGREHLIDNLDYHSSWDWLMPVRYKIQEIGAHLTIDGTSSLRWWYSSKKTGTFSKGAGGGGGWTETRDPFDSIFGKHYSRDIGVGDSAEKINRETEILATWDNIVYFIKWLNKTCPHLRNHIHKENED